MSKFVFKQGFSKELFFRKYDLYNEGSVEKIIHSTSKEVASCEATPLLRKEWQKTFYDAIALGGFIPAGRILANARAFSLVKNYNNCFTIDLEDDMESIYLALSEDAMIGKVGGGVGFNASKLRPKFAFISKGGESSGVMSFIEIFDTSNKAIHTGGGRRGAHLFLLNVDHPDIEEFITYKRGEENNKLTQFNISVGITDDFIEAVILDKDWNLVFPLMKKEERPSDESLVWKKPAFDLEYARKMEYTINEKGEVLMKIYKTVKAKELYNMMAKHAWWYNEPGALFLDTVERDNNAPHHFSIDRANPCVAEGTLVDTPSGPKKVEDIELGENISTLHPKGYESVKTIERHENTLVNKIVFTDGNTQYVTDSHIYFVMNDELGVLEEKRLDEISVGDMVQCHITFIPKVKTADGVQLNTVYVNHGEALVKVEEIERHVRRDTVYDLYCEESDTWITSGIVQKGCGEVVMPSYAPCCLSSINLSSLVKNPFTDNAYFDFKELERLVRIGVRFLDNVLDVTDYPLEKIREMSQKWRRIGLGGTGFGDALLKMKIRYGSPESIVFLDELGEAMAETAYNASVDLAIERGPFPGFDEKIGDFGFIKKLSEKTQARIKKFGLRNIGLLSFAPAGTISITMGNNCSSGIEPIFSLEYERTIKQDDGSSKTEFVYNDSWIEFKKFSGLTINDKLPDYVVTSHDISIKEGIDVQATLQKWIDHSISRTVNMPFETTLEEYKDIFIYAWKKGLKGITSFHEGAAMEGVLSTVKKKQEPDFWKKIDILANSKKRPESLECDIYEMQVNKQRVIVLIGLDDDDFSPYEVFLTVDEDSLVKLGNIKKGQIVKNGKGAYNLVVTGKTTKIILENITQVFDDDYATMCRLLSLSLRHKIPLQFIVDQLNKTKRFDTFSKAVARVLKKYIGDGEKVISRSEGSCPECGSELQFVEGCRTCRNCGWSKC